MSEFLDLERFPAIDSLPELVLILGSEEAAAEFLEEVRESPFAHQYDGARLLKLARARAQAAQIRREAEAEC